MAAHVRRFDRAMTTDGGGVLEGLLDHLATDHDWTPGGDVAPEAYAVVQLHEDLHRRAAGAR